MMHPRVDWLIAEAREYGIDLRQVLPRVSLGWHFDNRISLWDPITGSEWLVNTDGGDDKLRVKKRPEWNCYLDALHYGWRQLGYVYLEKGNYITITLWPHNESDTSQTDRRWNIRSVCLAASMLTSYGDPLV
jgi:hypothetical protein